MQITIKRNITQELDCFKIKTGLLTKSVKPATIFLIIGIGLIFICRSDFGVTDTSKIVYIFSELFFFILSFSLLKTTYKNKKRYKDFSKSAIKDYGVYETYSTMIIDKDYFIYESLRKYHKLSWSSLSMYQLYKENLILIMDSYITSFIIRPEDLSPNDFTELLLFASMNLKLRKK